MISTFCLSSASKSVLSFQLLFLNLIGRFPTYLPSVKAEVTDYLLNIRVNLQFGSKEKIFCQKTIFFKIEKLPFISLRAPARSDGLAKLTKP